MVKRLTRTGNSWALILERTLLERAGIDAATPLEVTADEDRIVVTALVGRADTNRARVNAPHARYAAPAGSPGDPIRVGLRELKAHLADSVRRARRGRSVLVTSRRDVVAELGPPRPATVSVDEALLALARRGLLTLGEENRRDLYPAMPPVGKPGLARRLLDETRGDR
jgi:antitoxin (DNA-binding transcriptional repressor) of toxin-antitoxin stability system/antitoxin component of MazEF toxin-antitoxin module